MENLWEELQNHQKNRLQFHQFCHNYERNASWVHAALCLVGNVMSETKAREKLKFYYYSDSSHYQNKVVIQADLQEWMFTLKGSDSGQNIT